MTKQCTVCARVFEVGGRNAKYCPECRKQVDLEQKRESKLRSLRRRACADSNMYRIAAKDWEARQNGTTYGPHVAATERHPMVHPFCYGKDARA